MPNVILLVEKCLVVQKGYTAGCCLLRSSRCRPFALLAQSAAKEDGLIYVLLYRLKLLYYFLNVAWTERVILGRVFHKSHLLILGNKQLFRNM